ncbi:MAG TPA: ankyrin repeat domain-containing protein [Dongiaceae bacterium]|nr:ankyrin repeat domain-containing protein [Dongiaceae bacterium]
MTRPDELFTSPNPIHTISIDTRYWLLENGFGLDNLDTPGRYWETPIILACRNGLLPQVEELIAAGVNINHRNADGTNCLWAAVAPDRIDIADLLLKHGVDIDNQNKNGATTLMYASSTGKTTWVSFLLDHGANPLLESLDGYTALDLAGNVQCMRLLRKLHWPIATARQPG